MKHLAESHAKIERKMAVCKLGRLLPFNIPQWIQWALSRVPKLLPTYRQAYDGRSEAGRAPFIRVAADATVKVYIPYTKGEAGHHDDRQQQPRSPYRRLLAIFYTHHTGLSLHNAG
jgi:hypothetical protein